MTRTQPTRCMQENLAFMARYEWERTVNALPDMIVIVDRRGTGQGLAISYDVVTRKHGGSLTFATILGEGTTFTVRLPVKRANSLESL